MDATGKTIVITGATAGVGEAAALSLARRGARIAFTARDRARGEAMLARLRGANPNGEHLAFYGDLSCLAEMKRVGAEIAAALPRIDVLANNAGAWFDERFETEDGLELTFAINHMAYFVITNALLDTINATPNARIANTTSRAHERSELDFDDLQSKAEPYEMLVTYGRSKLANILFTQELARRLALGHTTTCHHPGRVTTGMWQTNAQARERAAGIALSEMLTPEESGEVLAWHALSDEATMHSGGYYDLCERAEPAPTAFVKGAAERLWRVSEAIAAGQGASVAG